ncbi:plasmid mobilization protein [Erwinia amylovora]|uniref:plasmid mobilization protein n=3 Tax=Erwinia amylovora TaxID=552 RepID=UPI000C06A310|nr:plasmid mobilization relaxosome protein MobC [Erwinia amylovora]UDJ88585.1 plasmid mobilization relaxosome protein MobC [Erwinia amylovora]
MAVKKNKTRVLSFRVSEEEATDFENRLVASGMSKSDYFREVFINQKAEIKIELKDLQTVIFYFNKSSNNLNQLAHQVNSAHYSNKISEGIYKRFINTLIDIRTLLLKGVTDADKS